MCLLKFQRFVKSIIQMINSIQDEVEKAHYINKVAEITGVNPEAVRQKSLSLAGGVSKTRLKTSVVQTADKDGVRVESLKNPESSLSPCASNSSFCKSFAITATFIILFFAKKTYKAKFVFLFLKTP